MTDRTIAITFILLLVLVSFPAEVRGQPGHVYVGIGDLLARDLTGAYRGLQQYGASKGDFNTEITAARKRFWALYPNKPGFAKAKSELAQLLFWKDYIFMVGPMVEGTRDRNILGIFDMLSGGTKIDGGIPEVNRPAFDRWVFAVRRGMGARRDSDIVFFNPLAFPAALAGSAREYAEYVKVRDATELWMGPHSPINSKDPAMFVGAVAFLTASGGTLGDSVQAATKLRKALGPVLFAQAAERLRKTAGRFGMTPLSYSQLFTEDFRPALRSNAADERYVLAMLLNHDPSEWSAAEARYRGYLAKHGRTKVAAIAKQLRAASKSADEKYIADYSGAEFEKVEVWLERLLSGKSTSLPAVSKPMLIDATNHALVSETESKGIISQVIGTVSRTSWETGYPTYLVIHFRGANNVIGYVMKSDRDIFKKIGPEGRNLIGKRIVIFGTLYNLQDGRFAYTARTPDSIYVATAADRPVSAIPEGVRGNPNRVWRPQQQAPPDPYRGSHERDVNEPGGESGGADNSAAGCPGGIVDAETTQVRLPRYVAGSAPDVVSRNSMEFQIGSDNPRFRSERMIVEIVVNQNGRALSVEVPSQFARRSPASSVSEAYRRMAPAQFEPGTTLDRKPACVKFRATVLLHTR